MESPTEAKRDWLTLTEAAEELDIPRNTAYTWRKRGRIKTVLAGKGAYLVHRDEIERVRQEMAWRSSTPTRFARDVRPAAPREIAPAMLRSRTSEPIGGD